MEAQVEPQRIPTHQNTLRTDQVISIRRHNLEAETLVKVPSHEGDDFLGGEAGIAKDKLFGAGMFYDGGELGQGAQGLRVGGRTHKAQKLRRVTNILKEELVEALEVLGGSYDQHALRDFAGKMEAALPNPIMKRPKR
jgi:hypothetical protein